jgi:hypothetical protein
MPKIEELFKKTNFREEMMENKARGQEGKKTKGK